MGFADHLGQETSLPADRLIHCLPVCVGEQRSPSAIASAKLAVSYVTSLLLESRACHKNEYLIAHSNSVFRTERSDHQGRLRILFELGSHSNSDSDVKLEQKLTLLSYKVRAKVKQPQKSGNNELRIITAVAPLNVLTRYS